MSDSWQPQELQHTRLPCPSLYPRVCSNSRPLSEWCYLTILSFAIPFSFCLQSFPASGSFPMSGLVASSGQRIGASALASALPVNIQSWFPSRLTGLISLLSKGLSRVFSSTQFAKNQFFGAQASLWSNSHIHTRLLILPTSPKILSLRFDSLLVHKCQIFSITISMRPLYDQIKFVSFSPFALSCINYVTSPAIRLKEGGRRNFPLSESYNSVGI